MAGVDARLGMSIVSVPKVFKRDDDSGVTWLFGYCGSFRMGQLLQYELKLPEVTIRPDKAPEFIATRFVAAVRECFRAGGFERTRDAEAFGGTFLVGVLGALYWVQEDYWAGAFVDPYAACGCGSDIALGAMHSQLGMLGGVEQMTPQQVIANALEAAQRHSAGVRGPWKIETVAG